jgi:hypothetical protein
MFIIDIIYKRKRKKMQCFYMLKNKREVVFYKRFI